MKPSIIPSLLLTAALCTPALRAQDAPAKVREIEQKVLLQQYQNAIQALVGSASEAGITPDTIAKRLQWLTMVDGQVDPAGKATAANQEEMTRNANALNEMAWNMITSPDAADRRPDVALQLADIAIGLSAGDADLKPNVLDTRARALFLLGKHDEAIAGQEQAVASSVGDQKAGFAATLQSYRKKELPPVAHTTTRLARPAADRLLLLHEGGSPLELQDLQDLQAEIQASRRNIEEAARARSGAAFDKTAAASKELNARLEQLEKLMELQGQQAGHPPQQPPQPEAQPPQEPLTGTDYILNKLRTIIIPAVDFQDTSVEEAVDFLRLRAAQLDTTELDPTKKGLNFVIRRPRQAPAEAVAPGTTPAAPGAGAAPQDAANDPGKLRIKELRMRTVPLAVALKYICDQTKLRYKVDDFAVTLVPQSEVDKDIFTRTFEVPPDFASQLDSSAAGAPAPGAPRRPIIEVLKANGINFGEGTSVTLTRSGTLMVTNTPTELDKIEQLIAAVMNESQWTRKETTDPNAPAEPAEH